MAGVTSVERRRAEAVVQVLEELLLALAGATVGADLGWLRPLAILAAEIEYSALRSRTLDSLNLANECQEVSDLLCCSSHADVRFASRYFELRSAPGLAALHDCALAACRAVAGTHDVGRPSAA
jgi:hypothetical protein